MGSDRRTRRSFLKAAGVAGGVALAGCSRNAAEQQTTDESSAGDANSTGQPPAPTTEDGAEQDSNTEQEPTPADVEHVDVSGLDIDAPQAVYDRISNAATVNEDGHVTIDLGELLEHGEAVDFDHYWDTAANSDYSPPKGDVRPLDGTGVASAWHVIPPSSGASQTDVYGFKGQYSGTDILPVPTHMDEDGTAYADPRQKREPMMDVDPVIGNSDDLPEGYMTVFFYETDAFNAVYLVGIDDALYDVLQSGLDQLNEQTAQQVDDESSMFYGMVEGEDGSYWSLQKTTTGEDDAGNLTTLQSPFNPVQVSDAAYIDGWVQPNALEYGEQDGSYSSGRLQYVAEYEDGRQFAVPVLLCE